MTNFEQYWIGQDIDLDSLWSNFDHGLVYINKFKTIEPYLLRLTFDDHPTSQPLFDHEVIYKTIKATFHDIKRDCLTPDAFDEASPIFLYRVERGSGIYEFLAQFTPLLPCFATFGTFMMYYRNAMAKDQQFDENSLNFIKKNFPHASKADLQAYMKACTTWGRRRVLERLIKNGLHKVEISKVPFDSNKPSSKIEMIDSLSFAQRILGNKND